MQSEANIEKRSILAHAEKRRSAGVGSALLGIGIAVALALGVAAAFGTTSETISVEIPRTAIVERLAITPVATQSPATEAVYTHEARIARGDTLVSVLTRLGVDDGAAFAFLRGNAAAQSMARQLSPGKSVAAWTSQDGSLQRLIFPLNGEGGKALIVERFGQEFSAKEQVLTLETRVVMKSAEIRYSLFGASDAAEIPDSIAIQLADMFGSDIDFHRDLRKGVQKWRAHKGIDYGAPVGVRVKATGTGVVEFVGRQGGYGNVVILRHQNVYTTLYGHLSKIEGGLRRGSRVHQGDVIGYVGATGLASGPHLHYEFRIAGTHQNPLAIALPSAPALKPAQLPDFKARTTPYFARIELIRDASTLALVN